MVIGYNGLGNYEYSSSPRLDYSLGIMRVLGQEIQALDRFGSLTLAYAGQPLTEGFAGAVQGFACNGTGHGGILDRFDSTVVVAPLTELLLLVIPFAVK